MMPPFVKISLIISFVFVNTEGGKKKAFDTDYFFDYPKSRDAHEISCSDGYAHLHCSRECGWKYSCISGQCYCKDDSKSNPLSNILDELKKYVETYYVKTRSEHKTYEDESVPKGFVDSTLRSKSSLRHHIAHFCPDLELARRCIRKCMALGKSAFCGKDHVCYCGHQYSSHDDNTPLNIDDMYAQFRDLYQKYFGKNTAYGDYE